MNIGNSKTNEPHRFRLTLADKFNRKDPNKNMVLANLSIYYTWKNIKPAYDTINLKSLFRLGMMNLICLLDHTLFQTLKIILNTLLKKHETIADNPLMQIYTNKIKNRIVFKINTGYKLELLSPKTMKLLGSIKDILIKMCKN